MRLEEAIGRNVARLRETAGLSQAQLGTALAAYLGKPWSRQAVSAAEKGRRAFTAAELVSLALALKTSLDLLLLPGALGSHGALLPGEAEFTDREYERAIVGESPKGDANPQSLDRARGALIAALRDQYGAYKLVAKSLESQAVFLDHASFALGFTDELIYDEIAPRND
ncbi:helix-turn-helix domain-containing protein [Streptomyces lunaelactis]|nr:helix-turn-helix transcriptional regulator [Streptomyces lunaelactis]NUK87131.1 helix-turn-helix transcriptional regulator [Streptomyces lunaelactis]